MEGEVCDAAGAVGKALSTKRSACKDLRHATLTTEALISRTIGSMSSRTKEEQLHRGLEIAADVPW